MIKYFCGNSDAGIYTFAYQIASAMQVVIAAIDGSRVPWTYEQLKKKTYTGLRRIISALAVVIAAIVLLISLLSPEVIGLIGTKEYATAVYVIPVVTLSVFYTFIYDLYASVEFYYGATKFVMAASVSGALLNIILNAIFIPLFGFIAAAYTTLVCYMFFMLLHYVFAKRVLRIHDIQEKVYDDRMLFALALVLSIVSLGCMMTYKYLIVRLILIAVIAVVCIIKRKEIKSVIMVMRE